MFINRLSNWHLVTLAILFIAIVAATFSLFAGKRFALPQNDATNTEAPALNYSRSYLLGPVE